MMVRLKVIELITKIFARARFQAYEKPERKKDFKITIV